MLRRPIPATGQTIPAVGLGTWKTFDPPALTPEHLDPLAETLRRLVAAGGSVVDTSPMYGKAEAVVGDLSARLGLNADLFVATKVWTTGEREGVAQMESSLGKLRRERVELMQVHNLVDWRTQLKTLRAWKDAGRCRYIGITHYQPSAFAEMERILRTEKGIDFAQFPYSVNVRDAERRLLPACADTATAVLINEPFAGGSLFGKAKGKPLPDHAAAYADSWAQAFLKFILADERVTCAVPGTGDPAHVTDNLAAATGRLPTAEGAGATRPPVRLTPRPTLDPCPKPRSAWSSSHWTRAATSPPAPTCPAWSPTAARSPRSPRSPATSRVASPNCAPSTATRCRRRWGAGLRRGYGQERFTRLLARPEAGSSPGLHTHRCAAITVPLRW